MSSNSNPFDIPAAELPASSRVKLEILPDAAALFARFARLAANEIQANNAAGRPTRLILPVGPVGQYPILVEICNQERISWQNVHTFNMDDYCDWQGRLLGVDHPLSFRGFMQRTVFDRLDPGLRIPPDQVHFPDPLRLDEIEAAIQSVGGIDTCYGGVGYHGHVAFNEPPISPWYKVSLEQFKASTTRLVWLAADSVVMNTIRNSGGNPHDFPPVGVTLGMSQILAARRIRMFCPGGMWQRYAVRQALLGEPSVEYPVTLLQGHPDYEFYLTAETAEPPLMGLS